MVPLKNGRILGAARRAPKLGPTRETMLDIFHRDPKVWEKYRDDANLLIYGTADPARIRLAHKEHQRRHRRTKILPDPT